MKASVGFLLLLTCVPAQAQRLVAETVSASPKVYIVTEQGTRGFAVGQERPMASGAPIAVSDFKHRKYTFNGKPVPYSDLWQATVGLGDVVPGVGWTYSKIGPFSDNYIPATKALNEALGSGFTVVLDFKIDTPDLEGSATVGVAVEAYHDPSGDQYTLAGAWFDPPSWGGSGGYPPYVGTTDAYAFDYFALDKTHRFAANLGPDEYISLDGRPVQHGASPHWGPDINAIYLDSPVESSWIGPQNVIVERVEFYALQDPDRLPALSRGLQADVGGKEISSKLDERRHRQLSGHRPDQLFARRLQNRAKR